MKRGFRLSRAADFKRVRRMGKKIAHPFLALSALPNDLGAVRVGVMAGKTVGTAVKRNRAKRVMRAAMQPFLTQIKPGYDIVLIAKGDILENKSPQVAGALAELLRKASLLK
ncbi:MAG: ribonuclease P protein component [Anaerolineales bacterium]